MTVTKTKYSFSTKDKKDDIPLSKKCPYSELFWSAFSHIRTECGKRYGVSLRIQSECGKMCQWFSLRPPNLNINWLPVERESLIKFFGVWIEENLTWRDHIHTVENKIAKNIGLLYQGKQYLDENCLKQIYFAYIHAYLSYANKN